MLLKAGCYRPLCLSNIPAWARDCVGAGAGYVVYMSCGFVFLNFVFGMDKTFPYGTSGADGGAQTAFVDDMR